MNSKMKTYIKQLSGILFIALMATACSKEEFSPYDQPFIHINVNDQDTVTVASNRTDTVNYNVYLSTKLLFEPVEVTYDVSVGDGLEEGRDFELITKGNTLTFPQGIFQRSVRIAWFASELDSTKTNKLTIRLLSNNKNYTLGLPGPDQLQKQLVITKE